MRADFGTFFDEADADVLFVLRRQLLDTDGRRQAGRAGADDDHVIFHRFAFHRALLRFVMGLKGRKAPRQRACSRKVGILSRIASGSQNNRPNPAGNRFIGGDFFKKPLA